MPNISKIKINNILYDIKDANGFSGSWNDLADKPFYEDESGNIIYLDDKFVSENIARANSVVEQISNHDTDINAHKSIQNAVAANEAAISLLLNGSDPETIDSVNDLINYVTEHGSEVTGIKADIKTNSDAIEKVKDAILYTEQALTDEQKAQARENVDAIGYEWHELRNGYCFVANIPNKNSINNFESSVTTEKYPNVPALQTLVGYVDFVVSDPTKTYSTDYYDEIISCITVLKESGDVAFPCNFLYTKNIHDINTYKSYFCNYISAIGMLVLQENSNTGTIQYQNGTIVTNTIFPDTTLTESARPADAKATGDAINAISALVGDTAVSEQITTALSENAVLYSEAQTLTDDQKLQAQTNIGIEIATDDEIIELLMQEDMFPVVTDSDGSLLADESDNILLW